MKKLLSSLLHMVNANSLRNRLIFLCSAALLVSFIYQLNFTSMDTYSRMLDQYSSATHESIEYASSSINSYLSDVRSWDNAVTGNLGLLNLLNQRSSNEVTVRKRLDSAFQNIFNYHDEIQRLVCWTAYDNQRTRISRNFEIYSYNWSTAEALSHRFCFSLDDLKESRFLIEPCTPSEGAIEPSMCFNVVWGIYANNGELLAILIAEIDFSAIDRYLFASSAVEGEILLLMDANERLIYYQGTEAALDLTDDNLQGLMANEDTQDGYDEITLYGQRYILFSSHPFFEDHRLLRLIPYEYFAATIYGSRTNTTIAFMVSILLTLLVISWGIYRMTRPINELGEAMTHMGEGNFGATLPTAGVEAELLPLIEHFNEMSMLIEHLFKEKYQLTIEQQKAELHALQAQINPHFLYNVLQIVNGQALKHNAYEIATIVNAMGDMLRYCIQKEETPATLNDEIENVKRYLIIQKMRFLSRLMFSIEMDAELATMPIPRMTLQPLVENCIVHGMDDTTELCSIKITARLKNTSAEIEVQNAGGMPIEQDNLQRLEEYLFDGTPEMNGHVGLKNCYLRLKYFYGDSTRFELSSSHEAGTCVRISIQRSEEESQ